MQFDKFALKSNARAFASRSKVKAKPQRRISASLSARTIPIGERWLGPILNHKIIRPPIIQYRNNWSIFFVMVIYLERWWSHWILEIKRSSSEFIFMFGHHWSDEKWKSIMAKRRRKQENISVLYRCFRRNYLPPSSSRSISGRNLIDPSLQDTVLIPDDFFKYIYHVGCAIKLHSIINSGLIPWGQNLSKRQTVFFLLVNPMGKEHKDPDTIDLNAPRLAQSMHKCMEETSKHCIGLTWILLKRKD